MRIYRQKLFSSIDPEVVLQFLGRLSGFIHRAKSLHWAAKGKDIHEYLDGLWKELYEFQDTVAEGWMGIAGRLSDASQVPCISADENSPMSFVREVESRTLEFYDLLPADDPRFKGLTGETESFIQTIEKYKYLFSLCFEESNEEKEFSEKKENRMDKKDWTAIGLGTTGVIGGSLLKERGESLAKDKLVEEAHNSLLKTKRNLLKNNQRRIRERMKAATDIQAYKDIAKDFDSVGQRIEKKTKEIAESDNVIKKLGNKSKKYKKAGKALLVTSLTAPIIYSTVRASKKHKEHKEKEK